MSNSLHILVVDDNVMMTKTLCDILDMQGYDAEGATSGVEALEKLRHRQFDVMISDIKMEGLNGVDLYRAIKARQPELPVVLMTAYVADELVQEGLDEGAIAVMNKPLDLIRLSDFLNYLARERSVVIVDDDPAFSATLGDILQMRQFSVTQVNDPTLDLAPIVAENQVVLLDLKLPQTNGLEVLHSIRERYPQIPIVIITGYADEQDEMVRSALASNAFACLAKPVAIDGLLNTLARIRYRELARILGRRVPKNSE